MNHYTYRAEWSPERDEYVGVCLELPGLKRWASTMQDAMAAVERAVDEDIAEREAAGEDLPTPITERRHSGTFMVRTSPMLHARLAVEAADQHVSMNHWVALKLADRPPTSLFDW